MYVQQVIARFFVGTICFLAEIKRYIQKVLFRRSWLMDGLNSSMSKQMKLNCCLFSIDLNQLITNIPAGIKKRLSSLSSDKASFDQAAPPYQKALDESGYHYTLQYEPAKTSKRKNRQRNNILWYNPPFCQKHQYQHRTQIPCPSRQAVTGRFPNWSFRLPPVRLSLDSIRLRTVCQFAYVISNLLCKTSDSTT